MKNLITRKKENVLVIPDLHIPAHHPKFLAFLKKTYKKFKCTKAISVGDVVDLNSFGRWELIPEMPSPGDELKIVRKEIQKYYKAFPDLIITLGNHDIRFIKKMTSAGLPTEIAKSINEILEVPNWKFVNNITIDNVIYSHGTGSPANILTAVQNTRMNYVRGHQHSKYEIQYTSGPKDTLWGMTVGCGVDRDHPAFSYGKDYIKKPILGCAVVLDGVPQLIPFTE